MVTEALGEPNVGGEPERRLAAKLDGLDETAVKLDEAAVEPETILDDPAVSMLAVLDAADEDVVKYHPVPRTTITNRTKAKPTISLLLCLFIFVRSVNSHHHFHS